MSQFSQLGALTEKLMPSAEMRQAFRALRAGVDYTQSRPPDGGNDGSIDEQTWTAARDAALAFEKLEYALLRLDDLIIPF